MLGTYAAAILVAGAALLVGQAVLAVCGWRRWSWLAPAVGLATIMALAWWTVRLPGEGTAALVAIGVASALSVAFLWARVEGLGEAVRTGAPAALLALAAASIPFFVEGRFGILGTGFNVDMSQHLFAADWLADPQGDEPGLVKQGYPLGPHALAVAGAELQGGNLVRGFSGLTIAVPVLAALSSLAVLRELPAVRRAVAASLVALPYLIASYLAQGQFKELLEALFVLAFALALHRLAAGDPRDAAPRAALLRAVPLAAIAAGAIYAYSAPGVAWLAGTAGVWALVEIVLIARRGERPAAWLRRGAAPAVIAVLVLAAAAAPDAARIVDFSGNARSVADASDPEPEAARGVEGRGIALDDEGGGGEGPMRDRGRGEARREFNDDLGNLFGDISPLEGLGVWASGDFRVQAGDGAVPASIFYAGAALALLALGTGLVRWLRRGEAAVPAALAVAAVIYLAALIISTPYTTAKALQMIAPLAMLIPLRELLAPSFLPTAAPGRVVTLIRRTPARAALAGAFAAAAATSSLLALGNAPVGPEEYSPSLAELRPRLAGQPTLVLAPPDLVSEEHGRAFIAWELRDASPLCIEPASAAPGGPAPSGIRGVIAVDIEEAPYAGLRLERDRGGTALWRRSGAPGAPPAVDPANPTDCGLDGLAANG